MEQYGSLSIVISAHWDQLIIIIIIIINEV